MKLHDDDPAQMLLTQAEYLEPMSNCLEHVAGTLVHEGKHDAAAVIIDAVRQQRIEAMLVRGVLAAW